MNRVSPMSMSPWSFAKNVTHSLWWKWGGGEEEEEKKKRKGKEKKERKQRKKQDKKTKIIKLSHFPAIVLFSPNAAATNWDVNKPYVLPFSLSVFKESGWQPPMLSLYAAVIMDFSIGCFELGQSSVWWCFVWLFVSWCLQFPLVTPSKQKEKSEKCPG